jgi:DNA-binding Xre family transcriptional regulator
MFEYRFTLDRLMTARGLSNVQLSADTGLAMSTIAAIRGDRAKQLDLRTITKLMVYFDMQVLSELVDVVWVPSKA